MVRDWSRPIVRSSATTKLPVQLVLLYLLPLAGAGGLKVAVDDAGQRGGGGGGGDCGGDCCSGGCCGGGTVFNESDIINGQTAMLGH